MPTNAIDAPFAAALPVQVGAAVTTYPFRENGDLATRVTTRPYKQAAAHYAPALYGTVDPADPAAYLIDESDPTPSLVPSLLRFERTYATIPLAQVIPTTKLFERPNLHDLKSTTNTYAVSFDAGITSTLFSSRGSGSLVAISDDTTPAPLTASDTVSITGSVGTATIYGDDTVAELLTAIQSSVGAGLTAATCARTRTAYEIDIYIAPGGSVIYSAETSTAGLLVEVLEAKRIKIYRDGSVPVDQRTISATSHGGAAGDEVALWNGDTLVCTSKLLTAPTNSFNIPAEDLPTSDAIVTHYAFKSAGTTIANGPMRCSAKRTQTYYLPGVSAGISDASDIVPPTVVTDPQSWLDTVVAYLASPSNTTFAVHEVSDLVQWRGPIVMQEVLSLQLADAVRQV